MRTGRYLTQSSGVSAYKAFIPNPLPFKVKMEAALQSAISRADQELGRLDGIAELLPDVNFFVLMYVGKEAALSSQVEGTRATFSDLLKVQADIEDAGIHDDVSEIQNYVRAMDYGLKRLETLPLSLRLIKEIHEILLSGVRGQSKTPGLFRKSQNWVGGSSIGSASFVPPPPHEVIPLLSNLEKYLHDRASAPVLLKTALAHLQFETIHPFLDGNGRTGRLLITFYLCQQGVLRKPLLYLSEYFMANRQEYYDRLSAAHDRDDLEGWLGFFMEGVTVTARKAAGTARTVLALREKDLRAVTGLGAVSDNAVKVLNHLYGSPYIRIRDVEAITGLSNPNAIALIARLAGLGILKEITGRRRNKVFAYTSYIEAFADG